MVTKKEAYQPNSEYLFLEQKRRQIALIRKRIATYGIDPNGIGIFTRPEYQQAHENRQKNRY